MMFSSRNIEAESTRPLTQSEKSQKTQIIKNVPGNNEIVKDLLKNISSTTSLPGYLKGEGFSSTKGVVNQCLVAGAALLLVAAAGCPIGYSAVALPQLQAGNDTIEVDEDMGSWIASIHSAATPFGSAISGLLAELLGRRRALLVTIMPIFVGWTLIATSTHVAQILVGRVVCGISVGLMAAPVQVYLGEISEPKLRGLLIGTPITAYSLGVLYVYLLGGYLHWRMVALLSMLLPVLAIIPLIISPESPTWLARRERLHSASHAIAHLRGGEELSRRELHQVVSAYEREQLCGSTKLPFLTTIVKPSVLKPLLLVNIFNLLLLFSGTFIVIFYAVDILKDMGCAIDPKVAAIGSAIIRVFVTLITCYLLLYKTRRALAITSGVGSTVTSLALAIYLYACKGVNDTNVILSIFSLYIAFNTLGFMGLPNIMIAELLPAQVRSLCGGYIFSFFNMLMFGTTKIFPLLKHSVGVEGLFIIFAVSSLFGTVFLFLMLPETRNRTLIDIERYYQRPNLFWFTRHRYNNTDSDE